MNSSQNDLLPSCLQSDLPRAWRLLGEGTFSWTVFKLYRARLFITGDGYVADQPFILELCYLRNLPAEMIISASLQELTRLRNPSTELLQTWSDALHHIVPDVGLNDRLIGCFIPGQTVKFYSANAMLGEVSDPVFAEGFAAIWLDPETRSTTLRESLLGLNPTALPQEGTHAST